MNDIVSTFSSGQGPAGRSARDLAMRANGNSLEWQREGDTSWQHLWGVDAVQGESATIALGTVTTGAPGSDVVITNTGTLLNAIFNFQMPRGQTGLQGIQGAAGAQGIQGAPGTPGKQLELTVDSGMLKWRYVGDTTWIDLISLNSSSGSILATNTTLAMSLADHFLNAVTVRNYGAVGDESADDSAAFLEMQSRVGFIRCMPYGRHRVDGSILSLNSNLVFLGNHATIIQNCDAAAIKFRSDYTDEQNVLEAPVEVSYALSSSGNSNVTRIKVENAAAYPVDTIVRIGSSDLTQGSNPANLECRGECATVGALDTVNNYLYFYGSLRETYVTNVKLWKLNQSNRCYIDDLDIDCVRGLANSYNQPSIWISGAYAPSVQNVRIKFSYSEALRLDACYAACTHNLHVTNLQTSASLFRYGYGIVAYSCEQGMHTSLFGQNCRHLYTTGIKGTSGNTTDGTPWLVGRTAYELIANSKGVNCQNGPFSTHCDAYKCTFYNCEAHCNFKGPSGGSVSYAIRGLQNRVVNCRSYGGDIGVSVFPDYDDPLNTNDTEILGFEHHVNERTTSSAVTKAISIDGNATANKMRCRVINSRIYGGANTSMLVHQNFSTVFMTGGFIDAPHAGTSSSARVIELDGDSTLTWDGGLIDYSKATTTGIRTIISRTDGCSATWKNGTIIKGASGWSYIADLKNTNSKIFVHNLSVDAAPGTASGVVNAGAGAAQSIDYKINNGVNGDRSIINAAYTASGLKDIALGNCGADRIVLKLSATVAGVSINSISPGNKIGQELLLYTDASSPAAVLLKSNPAGLVKIPADTSITQSCSARLLWVGTDWTALSASAGPAGPAATVSIGTVTTGAPGTNASVVNVGTANDAVLNITVPRGDAGSGVRTIHGYVNTRFDSDAATDTVEKPFINITIPAGALLPNGFMRVTISGEHSPSTVPKNYKVKFGNGAFGVLTTSSNTYTGRGFCEIYAANDSNLQKGVGNSLLFGSSGSQVTTGTADTTVDQFLTILGYFNSNVAGEHITLLHYCIEIFS